jgi:hypothetical protein
MCRSCANLPAIEQIASFGQIPRRFTRKELGNAAGHIIVIVKMQPASYDKLRCTGSVSDYEFLKSCRPGVSFGAGH